MLCNILRSSYQFNHQWHYFFSFCNVVDFAMLYLFLQSDSALYIYTHILLPILSIIVYHRILNTDPCAIEYNLVYPLYICVCIYVYSLHLLNLSSHSVHPSSPSPLAITGLFSMSVCLFLFHKYVHLCHILVSMGLPWWLRW